MSQNELFCLMGGKQGNNAIHPVEPMNLPRQRRRSSRHMVQEIVGQFS